MSHFTLLVISSFKWYAGNGWQWDICGTHSGWINWMASNWRPKLDAALETTLHLPKSIRAHLYGLTIIWGALQADDIYHVNHIIHISNYLILLYISRRLGSSLLCNVFPGGSGRPWAFTVMLPASVLSAQICPSKNAQKGRNQISSISESLTEHWKLRCEGVEKLVRQLAFLGQS